MSNQLPPKPVDTFWRNWILAASGFTAAFGAFSILNRRIHSGIAFNLVAYGTMSFPSDFSPNAEAYSEWISGILASALIGWGTNMSLVALGPFTRGDKIGWDLFFYPLLCWCIPDSIISILKGFPQNAVTNLAFVALFFVPLIATRRHFYPEDDSRRKS